MASQVPSQHRDPTQHQEPDQRESGLRITAARPVPPPDDTSGNTALAADPVLDRAPRPHDPAIPLAPATQPTKRKVDIMTHSACPLIAHLASTTLCLTLSSVVSGCTPQVDTDVADDSAALAASVAQNASVSPLENAITANAATPDPTATASVSSGRAAVACYHYFGDRYDNSDCHSFWFDSNLRYLEKHCEPGPCNPFPRNWSWWTFWGDGDDNVLCAGAWSPSEGQRQQLRAAFNDAPNC